MKDALAKMRRHTLATEAGRMADRAFHDALLRATHNSAAVSWTTEFKQRSRALPRDPVPDHAKVCDAFASPKHLGDTAVDAWKAASNGRRLGPALDGALDHFFMSAVEPQAGHFERLR